MALCGLLDGLLQACFLGGEALGLAIDEQEDDGGGRLGLGSVMWRWPVIIHGIKYLSRTVEQNVDR